MGPTRTFNLLIVENEDLIRKVYDRIFGIYLKKFDEHYAVTYVRDIDEGIEAFNKLQRNLDLIVVTGRMRSANDPANLLTATSFVQMLTTLRFGRPIVAASGAYNVELLKAGATYVVGDKPRLPCVVRALLAGDGL